MEQKSTLAKTTESPWPWPYAARMVAHDMKKVAVERAEEQIRMNLAEYLEKGVVK